MSNIQRKNLHKTSYNFNELQSIPNSGLISVCEKNGTRLNYSNQCIWLCLMHYLILVEGICITITQLRDIASKYGSCPINDEHSMFNDHYESLINVLNHFNIKLRIFRCDRDTELFYEETMNYHYNSKLNSDRTVFIKYLGEHFELIYKMNDKLLYKDVGFDVIYDYLIECSRQISAFPDNSSVFWELENEGMLTNISRFLENETNSSNSPKSVIPVNSSKSSILVNSSKSSNKIVKNSTVEKTIDLDTKLSDVREFELIFENLCEDLKLRRIVNKHELLNLRDENSKSARDLVKSGIAYECIIDIIKTHSKQENDIIESNLQNETNILTQINEYYQILESKCTSIIISLRREIELLCEDNKTYECIMTLQDATEQIKYDDIFNQYEYNKICQNGKEKIVNEITIKMDKYYILCNSIAIP